MKPEIVEALRMERTYTFIEATVYEVQGLIDVLEKREIDIKVMEMDSKPILTAIDNLKLCRNQLSKDMTKASKKLAKAINKIDP